MSKWKLAAVAIATVLASSNANATTYVYDNLNFATLNGDCSFSTTCAAAMGRGDEYAAQLFTLSSGTTLDLGAFSDLIYGALPTSVNYAFYDDVSGLPGGPALASGSSTLISTPAGYDVWLESFNFADVTLAPGSYFFAIQAVASDFDTYLQQGLVTTGAAETHDGGATWSAGYENSPNGEELGGISVALGVGSASAPEPATWAMMLAGLGMLGFAMRRLRKA